MNENELLVTTVQAADEKKAEDIVVLNMKGISLVTDYFVICHGNSERQVQAIANEIKEQVHKKGFPVKKLEGFEDARWILVDLGDVVVHVFHRDERTYYNLERLWGDAPVVQIQGEQMQ